MTTTLIRLAFAGIRSRLLATVLTIMIAGAAAATMVIALEVRASGLDPWQQTFSAAHGARVLAELPSQADARKVAALSGVAEQAEPVPSVYTSLTTGGDTKAVQLAGLRGRPRINAPVRTEGAALPGAGIVLERSFAEALAIRVGTVVDVPTVDGTIHLRVVGTAILPSQPRYPRHNPGLAWVTRSALEKIEPLQSRWRWTLALRVEDPASAAGFRDRAASSFPSAALSSGEVSFQTWQEQRDQALLDSQPMAILLTMFTILLLTIVFAVVAILSGARAAAQYREIGLLKAGGLTPRQVSTVFMFETAAIGLVAVALGFALGATLAPSLAAPSAQTLLGSPTIAANPWHALLASCVILPVLLVSAFASTRRNTGFTVLSAIGAGTVAPASTTRLGRLISRSNLPLPATLGLKDLFARRRRALWLASAITVTGAVIVVTLSMQSALDTPTGEVSDVPRELPVLVYTLDGVLVLIAVITLIAVTLLSVRERIRDFGVLKAIGLTPAQITSSLVSAQAALATIASVLSVPVGIGLYLGVYRIASGSPDGAVLAPWWWFVLVPIAIPMLVAIATVLPARLSTRVPAADAVRYE
jgi:putative ABC transport system permease protein